jgi:hypothetical protein
VDPGRLVVLTLLLSTFVMSAPAAALVPRVAICGRVTSFVDAAPPADRIVKLGTQEPRRLALGSQVPQLGQEVCIWGYDVENKNPPASDPAPKGITGYGIAPVASIGCATVIDATALWNMPGERNGLPGQLPDLAFLALPLSKPAGDGCVRIAVDAQGNPVAAVVPRAATSSPAVSTPSLRPSAASLPSTSGSDDRMFLVLAFLGVGALVAAAGVLARRRWREIPS